MSILPHRPFNFLLDSFSPFSDLSSMKTVTGHAFDAPEGLPTVHAFEYVLLQSKERGGSAEKFGSFQNSDTELEQWS